VTHTDPRYVAGAGKVPQRKIEVADNILVPRDLPKTKRGERPDHPIGQHLVQQLQVAAQFALPACLVQRVHPLRGRQHVNRDVVGNRMGTPEQQFVSRIGHADAGRKELPVKRLQPRQQGGFRTTFAEIVDVKQDAPRRIERFGAVVSTIVFHALNASRPDFNG
jgi:hypothetical protein